LPKNPFFELLKSTRHRFDTSEITSLFTQTNQGRVQELAARLSEYIKSNLPASFENREGLASYRTNPYVLMTSAHVMRLADPSRFADFLFNSKLYMGLEGSFGKSIEAAFVSQYPIDSPNKWIEPPEKLAEFALLEGLNREERARVRTSSVWREIDKSYVVGNRRYLTSIKSGPNTINDTQVQAMTQAVISNHRVWAEQSGATYAGVTCLDVVIGLTYGTDKTTNNKENQILAKLMAHGFREEDRVSRPGVLIDEATSSVRVYRKIGKDFWAFIGNPVSPNDATFVFLEALLALSQALSTGMKAAEIESRINERLMALATALAKLQFSKDSLPDWVRDSFSEDQLFWFATAVTAFYDDGI
jgi:hypothetical protein